MPPDVAISLASAARPPSEMGDGREKHPVAQLSRRKIPTTYWCDVNCPGTRPLEAARAGAQGGEAQEQLSEDGGVGQQRSREAEGQPGTPRSRTADELRLRVCGTPLSRTGAVARAFREAIALGSTGPWRT